MATIYSALGEDVIRNMVGKTVSRVDVCTRGMNRDNKLTAIDIQFSDGSRMLLESYLEGDNSDRREYTPLEPCMLASISHVKQ